MTYQVTLSIKLLPTGALSKKERGQKFDLRGLAFASSIEA
jgi:hypothetical protein